MQESQIQFMGFEFKKELYENDAYFKEAFEPGKNPTLRDRIPWLEYMLYDGLLCRNS